MEYLSCTSDSQICRVCVPFKRIERIFMSVAKVTEIIASSSKSFDDAVTKGVTRADKTLKGVKSIWVKEQKAMVENGKISEYRVTMKVSFILKD